MKRINLFIATAVLALFSVSAFAQTEAGKFKVGTGTAFSIFSGKPSTKVSAEGNSETIKADDAVTNIELGVDLGYFVIDNLSVGAKVGVKNASIDGNGSTTWMIAPAATYYFNTNTAIRPFVSAEVGYASMSTKSKGKKTTSTTHVGGGLHYGAFGGVAYFLNSNVALTAEVGYTSNTFSKTEDKITSAATVAGVASQIGFTICF